jgi:cobalt transporter subunit CbtB
LNTQISTTAGARETARSETLVAALVALAFGVGLVFTTGFAHPSTIHNAAHDTRHALSFPCH